MEKDEIIQNLRLEVENLNSSLQIALETANKKIDFERNDREHKQILELSKQVNSIIKFYSD